MMSLQEMSDRMEIQKNLHDYAMAVDLQDWDALDHVFAEDATLDYVSGGMMTRAEVKKWLAQALGRKELGRYYHLLGHMRITMKGKDQAESITACFNPMETLHADGRKSLMLSGPFYHWFHVRTPAGWRIKSTLARSELLNGFRYMLPPVA